MEESWFLSSYCTSRVFSPTFRLLSIKFCLTIMIDSVFVFQVRLQKSPLSHPPWIPSWVTNHCGLGSLGALVSHCCSTNYYKLSDPSITNYLLTVLDVRNIQIKMSQDCISSGGCREEFISLLVLAFEV